MSDVELPEIEEEEQMVEGDDYEENKPNYKYVCSFEAHRQTVTSVKFSKCGRFLASCSDDLSIAIYNVENAKFLRKIETGHSAFVNEVCWTPNSKSVISASDDYKLKLLNASTGQCTITFVGHYGKVTCCDVHPGNNVLISGSCDENIIFWNIANGVCTKVIRVNQGHVTKVNFNCNGSLICSSSTLGFVHIWSTESGEPIETIEFENSAAHFVKFFPNDKHILTNTLKLRLWNFRKAKHRKAYKVPLENDECVSPSFSLTGDHECIVSGSRLGKIYIWDLSTKELVQTLSMHGTIVRAIDCHPHEQIIASAGDQPDSVVRLWKSDT